MHGYYQRGIAQIVVVLVILVGLALGVYLIGQKTFFKPKAGLEGTRIEIAGANVAGDKTTSRQVKVKAYYIPPTVSAPAGGYPTPSSYQTPAYQTPSGGTIGSTVEYELSAGDNFIGLPFKTTFTYDPAKFIQDTNGKCSTIWTTNAGAGTVMVYPSSTQLTDYFSNELIPASKQSYLDKMVGGRGYFVTCSSFVTVRVRGESLTSIDEIITALRLIIPRDPKYMMYIAAPFGNQNATSRIKSADILNRASSDKVDCNEIMTPRVICTTSGEACSISGTTSYVKGGYYGNFTLWDDTGYAVKCSAKSTSVSAPVSYQTPSSVQGATAGSYITPPPAGGAYPTHFRVSNDTAGLATASEFAFTGNPTEVDWVLTSGNGTKTIYAEFKLNGVWGNRVSASINLAEPSISEPVTPTPRPVSGFGKAASFRGTSINPQYIRVDPKTAYTPISLSSTIEAWVKPLPPSLPINSPEYTDIITKSSGSSNSYNLTYVSAKQADGTVKYHYEFQVADSNIGCALVTASSLNGTVNDSSGRPINGKVVSENQVSTWRHVAGVFSSGTLYLFENGQLIAKNDRGITGFCKSSAGLQIGARELQGSAVDRLFQGEVDEVRLSRSARYTSNFTPQRIPFTSDANTAALYHLDGNGKDATGGTEGLIYSPIQFNFVDSTIPTGVISSPVPTPTQSPTPRPTPSPTPRIGTIVNFTPPVGSVTPQGSGRVIVGVQSYDVNTTVVNLGGSLSGLVASRTYLVLLCPTNRATCETSSVPDIVTDQFGSVQFKDVIVSVPGRYYVNNPITQLVVINGGFIPAGTPQNTLCRDRFKPCLEGNFSLPSPSPSPSPTPSPTPRPTPTPTPTPVACSACSADINKDGVVNMQDFSRLSSCFNKRTTDTVGGVSCSSSDLNGDGVVTILDFSCLSSKFNQRCQQAQPQPTVRTQTVPNNPPTITSSVGKGFFTRIVITAQDVDRDNINVTVSGKPANSYGPYCFGSGGVRTCYIYTRSVSGTITATASDGKGGQATTSVNLPLK